MTNFAAFNAKEQFYFSCFAVVFFVTTCLTVAICKDTKAIKSPLNYCSTQLICSLARMGGDSLSLFYQLKFSLVNMPKNNEICPNVKISNVTATSAHETCAQFITFVKERYPMLNSIKFKISKNGKHLALRARYLRRAIHAAGMDFEKTMSCFMYHLIRKMSLEKYYPTKAEMLEQKPQEPFFVGFRCFVQQNNVNGDNIHKHNVPEEKPQTNSLIGLLKTKDVQINKSQEHISKSQEHISKGQEQIDRLIGLVERQSDESVFKAFPQ